MPDMKVEGPRAPQGAGGGKRAAPAAQGFAAPTVSPAKVGAASAIAPPPALDAVLALQDDGQGGRRTRQMRRGARTLDALDALRLGLLQGRGAAAAAAEIEALGRDRAETGDGGLDAVLLEIDTRAAVELAKLRRQANRTP